MYSVGSPPRTFPLCPNCFNSADWALEKRNGNPDDKDDEHKEKQIRKMAGKSLVLECPLPDTHPLIDELYVSPDPDSDGVFILDPHFGPKWRLVGTRDATIIHLPKSISKITVLDEKDEVLGCHKMRVEFKSGESPLEGGVVKYTCSYPTDVTLQSASRVYHGSERTASKGKFFFHMVLVNLKCPLIDPLSQAEEAEGVGGVVAEEAEEEVGGAVVRLKSEKNHPLEERIVSSFRSFIL